MTAIEDLDFTVECVNCPNEARFYTQLHNCQTESGTEELVLCEEEFTKMVREAVAAIRDPRGSECPHCHLHFHELGDLFLDFRPLWLQS